jgi:prolyl-tRNA synthetase
MMETYVNIFKKLGLTAIPVAADSGSIGGDYSHEFHVLAETGESEIFFDSKLLDHLEEGFSLDVFRKFYAAEKDKHDPNNCPLSTEQLSSKRGIEVGHVFYLGEKYSKAMDVKLQDANGNLFHPHMGCYGIGVSRLMAAIIEASHDENGIIWPESVAPFAVGIIPLGANCLEAALSLEENLSKQGIDALVDDSDDHAGSKFSKMDLLGLPLQVVIGNKGLSRGVVEVKTRNDGQKQEISLSEIEKFIVERIKR